MTSETRPSPRLTIVIPTVNRASLVDRAIDSALAQTYPDLEICANGSSPKSAEGQEAEKRAVEGQSIQP